MAVKEEFPCTYPNQKLCQLGVERLAIHPLSNVHKGVSNCYHRTSATSATAAKAVRIADDADEAGLSPYVLTKQERATLDPNYKKPRRKVRESNRKT